MRKGVEALPSAGIYTRYKRRLPGRRQSGPELRNSLERIFTGLKSFSLDEQVADLNRGLERMAKTVLRQFVNHEGLAQLDARLESLFRGNRETKRRHLIERRIDEIRVEAEAPNATELLKMRKRLADAEGAADALVVLSHTKFLPVWIREAKLAEQSGLAVWRTIIAAFEMGQAYERIRVRPIEAYARTAIVRVKKTSESNRQRLEPKRKDRLRAYEMERNRKPHDSHWSICSRLAPCFTGNRGRPLTAKAFSNSIPKSKRAVRPQP